MVIITSAVGFLEMYIAMFPALQKQAAQMSKLMESYPDSFFKAFNIDKASLTFEKIGQYLAMEQFNFIWPILAIVLAIGFANHAFAYEKERGTIELTLSQPISRTRIFLSKYLAGFISILGFSLISILAVFPLTKLHGINLEAGGVLTLTALSILFAVALFGLAFLASIVFKEKSKVSFVMGGLLILMYVLNIIANLKDSLHLLKYFSFFYYYNPSQIIDGGNLPLNSILIFIAVITSTFFLGLFWFNKQDITV